MPKISVIMPVYNTEKYVGEAIESILGQSFKDFELIIVDDGSSDGSVEVIRKYLEDPRIVFLKNDKNSGIVYSLNRGLRSAKAPILALMESDDVSLPERFAMEFSEFESEDSPDLVGCWSEIMNAEWEFMREWKTETDILSIRNKSLFSTEFVTPWIMFKKKAIENLWGFSGWYVWDSCFYLHLVYGGGKYANVPVPLIRKREFPASTLYRKFLRVNWQLLLLRISVIRKFLPLRVDLQAKVAWAFLRSVTMQMIINFTKKVGIYHYLKR